MKLRSFPNDRQMDMMDCGPACLKMITNYYGKFYSLQFLRDKCGATKEGVSFLDMSHAAESIGLRSLSIKCTLTDLLHKIPLPVIVHWDNSHFVIVHKVKSSLISQKSRDQNKSEATIYVSDPAKGHIKYKANEFASKWIKSETDKGILMALEPQADFHQRQGDEKLERKKTFEIL
jgi:ATP-binding cassette subfamily B protein